MAGKTTAKAALSINSLFGGKSPVKSMTAWGLFIYAVGATIITAGVEHGIIGASLGATLGGIVDKLGVVLAGLGLRRAI